MYAMGHFDLLVAKLRHLDQLEAGVRARRQEARAVLSKCISAGALSAEQAARIEYDINAIEAAEHSHTMMAKAMPVRRRGPQLDEIIRKGWFSELQPAPFQ